MAEKGFGVKEVNLIGASGTPTITSPNNLNLNAVNVAISTNATVGGTLSVTGNVSVGGTLTYEDVTSIDSIGIVTAREGVFIPDNKTLKIGNTAGSPDFIVYHDGTSTILTNNMNGTTGAIVIQPKSGEDGIKTFPDGAAELYFNSNKKLETSNTGVTVTGTLVATTFSGSGASLTSLPAANLTGTLPAISGANLTNLPADTPTNSDIQVVYTVTANGSSAYRFGGNGIVSTADNPDVYLIRGLKYRFINNSGGSHPFQIRQSSGGSAYSSGVTNNGAASGNIDFQVPYSAPSHLYYQCTSHGGMVGNLYIRGAGGNNTNVGVTTFSGAVNVTAAVTADDFRTDSSSSTFYLTSASDWRFRTTGGSEKLRIDSSGRLLIGTTSNVAGGAINSKIQVRSTSFDAAIAIVANRSNAAAGNLSFTKTRGTSEGDTTIVQDGDTLGTINFFGADGSADEANGASIYAVVNGTPGVNDMPGRLIFATTADGAASPTERLRIDSSGRLLVGTASRGQDDADNLTIDGSGEGTGRTGITIRSATNTFGSIFFSDATSGAGQYDGVVAYDHSTQTMRFSTASTQRVYINSDGVVSLNSTYAGSTTNGSPIMLINPRVTGSNTMGIKFQARADVYNVTHIQFEHAVNQQVMGSITSANAGATSYNTTSDYRLKENVSSITDGISRVKQLLPKKFNFIIDETNTLQDGFLAHEVSSIVPEAITGEKDAVEMQQMDQSKLVPLITAALKEAITKIETLEAKVATLEGS